MMSQFMEETYTLVGHISKLIDKLGSGKGYKNSMIG